VESPAAPIGTPLQCHAPQRFQDIVRLSCRRSPSARNYRCTKAMSTYCFGDVGSTIGLIPERDFLNLRSGRSRDWRREARRWRGAPLRSSRRDGCVKDISFTVLGGIRCSDASSTMPTLTERSRSISTTRNCRWPNSGGCCAFTRVVECGSPSCLGNSYRRTERSKSANQSGGSAEACYSIYANGNGFPNGSTQ
jgi:hypothetical protein